MWQRHGKLRPLMSFHALLITQTIIGVLGIVPAYMIGIGSVISAANAKKDLRLAAFAIGAGLALPWVLGACLIGMWVARAYEAERTAMALLALPWAHLMVLIAAMLRLLRTSA